MRLAELAHVEEVQVALVGVELLGQDLGQMGLADTGRAGEAEYCHRLVGPLRRQPPAQLRGHRIDSRILTDDAPLELVGEHRSVDGHELAAARFVSLLERGLISETIEHIHDPPREIATFVEDDDEGAGGAEQRDECRERRTEPHQHRHEADAEQDRYQRAERHRDHSAGISTDWPTASAGR